ncbi:MAG: hypothetical protein U0802_11725 [Candidatus Binatia bacterium]
MLDPELDLESDLGVDTVKQAELFATIRAEYGIPRDDQLKLRDFPTLNHVFQFVRDRAPGAARSWFPSRDRGRPARRAARRRAGRRRRPPPRAGSGAAPAARPLQAHRRHPGRG